jgi:hypothetical protein
MEPQTQNESPQTDNIPWPALSWWLLLIITVLAIPSLAFVVVTVTGIKGIMGILVFMVACWACTYFGMYLVTHPNCKEKIDFTKK